LNRAAGKQKTPGVKTLWREIYGNVCKNSGGSRCSCALPGEPQAWHFILKCVKKFTFIAFFWNKYYNWQGKKYPKSKKSFDKAMCREYNLIDN